VKANETCNICNYKMNGIHDNLVFKSGSQYSDRKQLRLQVCEQIWDQVYIRIWRHYCDTELRRILNETKNQR